MFDSVADMEKRLLAAWRPCFVPSLSILNLAMGKVGNIGCSRLNKIIHEGFQCVIWVVWKWRNKVVNITLDTLAINKPEDIFSFIQRISNFWISCHCSMVPLD